MSVTVPALLAENLLFFVLTLPGLIWGWSRYRHLPGFPGPVTPWPAWFKVWFKVIWAVGGLLPLVVFVWLGITGQWSLAALALGPYFVMFALQIATELTCIRLGSPVWVAVPCFYLPWRLVQLERGLAVANASSNTILVATVWALIALWVINIWVHFSGMPNQMRWGKPVG